MSQDLGRLQPFATLRSAPSPAVLGTEAGGRFAERRSVPGVLVRWEAGQAHVRELSAIVPLP